MNANEKNVCGCAGLPAHLTMEKREHVKGFLPTLFFLGFLLRSSEAEERETKHKLAGRLMQLQGGTVAVGNILCIFLAGEALQVPEVER